eukprot:CAMPEP_0194132692 /NCGR_PEP_ID=MMETSP0152-20130528/3101_1 /TAXON_ID=1049557 /ORGANISM="Thalassiothrix antarctica, Strain L6-D1" /LENGTH=512 /DNA_ID=CAMNT_0038827835 /DNA_START=29 /DNA_END=1567 /DNA_ORIENTATION=+
MSPFKPVARPEPIVPESTLDEELCKAADEASISLSFINISVISASDLVNKDVAIIDKSDPYCEVQIGDHIQKTETVNNNLNPTWNKKMNFFLPFKPESVTLRIKDLNVIEKDDYLGEVEFELYKLMEINGSFEGELPLKKTSKGKIRVSIKCRTLKPFETEIKLGYTQKQLDGKSKEQEATLGALDESEEMRKMAIETLTEMEQQTVQQAVDIAKNQELHTTELSEKEKEILDQSQLIEAKIQEFEEAEVALRKTELEKAAVETRLTEAEEQILLKAKELEEKQRENDDALHAKEDEIRSATQKLEENEHTNKELEDKNKKSLSMFLEKEEEILAVAEKLEEKALAHEEIRIRLEQVEALKVEIENELTAKEKVILEQTEKLGDKMKDDITVRTARARDLLQRKKELSEKEEAALASQKKQDELEVELGKIKEKNDELLSKIDDTKVEKENDILSTQRNERNKQVEVDRLYKLNEELKQELKVSKEELQKHRDIVETTSQKAACGENGCSLM